MENTLLKEKIDVLPENLKKQVSDYIDFLLFQHDSNRMELSTEEKVELDSRWEAYEQGGKTSSLSEVKERLEKKYGLSS